MSTRSLVLSVGGLAVLVAAAALIPAVSPYGRDAIDLVGGARAPSLPHWFGTDELGRDLLTRVAAAGRTSLYIATCVALLTTVIAAVIGFFSGHLKGPIDTVLMRVTDFFLAIPVILVLLTAAAFLGGGGPLGIILVLAVFGWMQPARAIRSHVEGIARAPYVAAARDLGASPLWIARRHLLPASTGLLAAVFSLAFAQALVAETTLSFLGFGIQPPTPSLGFMLRSTLTAALSAPWLAVFPGAFVALAVLLANAAAEAFQRAGDPLAGAPSSALDGAAPVGNPADTKASAVSVHPPLMTIDRVTISSRSGPIVSDVDLEVAEGKTLTLIGQTGAGKSTVALAACGLLSPALSVNGTMHYRKELFIDGARSVRGRGAGFISQDPYASFVPSRSIDWHFRRVHSHHLWTGAAQCRRIAAHWLSEVGIEPDTALARLPEQFSGGELQRIAIALALSLRPKLLIADEPTSSLDTTTAAAVLDLLSNLQKQEGFALLLVTHDLGIVFDRADQVAVVAEGRVSKPLNLSSLGMDRWERAEAGELLEQLAGLGANKLVTAARSLRC